MPRWSSTTSSRSPSTTPARAAIRSPACSTTASSTTRSTRICTAPSGPRRRCALSVVIFDLDRFKSVNDLGGHAAGDRTLRTTAGAVAAACRTTDSAFRIGGDEFALVLPRADADAAARIARRAADAIERVAHHQGVSFGIATFPADGANRDALLFAADSAMYTNKGRGAADGA